MSACLIALVAVPAASGQSCSPHLKRYEFVPLGQLALQPTADSFAFGINDLGEIVGTAEDSNSILRATLWLYCQHYDELVFPARTLINLTSLAQQSGPGVARDINNAGDVAGSQTFDTENGFIWRLSQYSNTPAAWTIRLQPGDFESVAANAVNDANPPTVVGTLVDPVLCPQPRLAIPGPLGFTYVVGDADLTMDSDNVLGSAPAGSEASDVNTASPVRVAGGTVGCSSLNPPLCEADDNALMWTLSPEGAVTLPDNGVNYGSRANAVNNAAMAAGWARVGNSACKKHSHWWSTPSGSAVSLHAVGWDSDDQSEALGMSDAAADGSVFVAGTSISLNAAALWTRDGLGSWTLTELTCEISPLCGWVLTQAYDVNESGWIVGVGYVDGLPSKQRAFLLRPIALAGDVNYDCVVDGGDLGLLLSAYGSAPSNCNFDLNLDATVDGADLGILLTEWGATCTPPCGVPEAMVMAAAEEANDADLGAVLVSALAGLGFESVANFNAWSSTISADKSAAVLDQLAATLSN